MKIGTQRAMDRLIGTFLCGVLSLFPWRYRQVPFGFQPHNVLGIIRHRRSPCDGNNVCLRGISPQRVLEKASEFLRQ